MSGVTNAPSKVQQPLPAKESKRVIYLNSDGQGFHAADVDGTTSAYPIDYDFLAHEQVLESQANEVKLPQLACFAIEHAKGYRDVLLALKSMSNDALCKEDLAFAHTHSNTQAGHAPSRDNNILPGTTAHRCALPCMFAFVVGEALRYYRLDTLQTLYPFPAFMVPRDTLTLPQKRWSGEFRSLSANELLETASSQYFYVFSDKEQATQCAKAMLTDEHQHVVFEVALTWKPEERTTVNVLQEVKGAGPEFNAVPIDRATFMDRSQTIIVAASFIGAPGTRLPKDISFVGRPAPAEHSCCSVM